MHPPAATLAQDADGPLIGGPIRARRQKAEMTLQAVAEAAAISPGYLSLIERDKAVPTLTTLDRIARALGVGLDHFVGRPQPTDCLTRGATRQRFTVGNDQLGYERVSAQFPGAELSSYVLTVAPGYASEVVVHAGEEHVYVLDGALVLTLEGERLRLARGDSVHYSSGRPHGWANPHGAPARVLWTGTHDIFAPRTAVEG
ncbi:cupin domain-containing protein [Rhodobacteraceae bacterium CCMM004]|nr:cupin domain-containing protein [Rhodobacteraceae bacterium CCMM004]